MIQLEYKIKINLNTHHIINVDKYYKIDCRIL